MTTHFSFTKPLLEAIPFATTGERIIYHDTHKNAGGLQLRVTTTAKTFFIQKRVNGKPERSTLGRFPDMTIEQARKRAAEDNAIIAKGGSLVAEKKRAKLEAKTLQEVMDDYLKARKDLKPRTISDMANAFKEVCPEWLSKPITQITPDMIAKRHAKHGSERSKARANLAMRYLRALYNYAIAEYQDDNGKLLVEINPIKKLSQTRAWYKIAGKQSYLNDAQIGPWVQAVMALPTASIRDYLLALLLTGLRSSEAQKLTWNNIDFTSKVLVIVDPKNGRDHHLPLSDYLLDMFTRRKTGAVSDYVFADHLGKRISNIRYSQAAIEEQTGVKFSPHDLRRSFVTIAERLDFPFSVLKRLLNHVETGNVTMGYIGADVDRLRAPMQKITDYVLKCAELKASAEIIQFKREAG